MASRKGKKSNDVRHFISRLETGSPRDQYRAGQELERLGREGEDALAAVLESNADAFLKLEILSILGAIKFANRVTLDIVMRQFSNKDERVRARAALSILKASPSVRRFLPHLKSIHAREESQNVRTALQKVIAHYKPHLTLPFPAEWG